ncbi:antitoxin Xre/MbcA/ParS toxin-binding domain-containing protein [Gordonia rhizosphera]|uniref:Uncharacterized protein n=1 Tax=Gordonia rhizosphera NBRC 16068 TaxID=1108045 RepID=K6WJQ9_9ACTN|nr:antitoxin Xre/MbcA/ParS toxin-binding domain-containing protein [Gordonia rhizosphera]GAB92377.1 hypothetical protein GORHZ_171_00500 [Gordonia rhizosphera NBRC 16068]
MSDLMDQKRALLDELTNLVDERFEAAERAGVDAALYEDTAAIAAAMVSALPAAGVHDQIVGPFYDTTGLTSWLGISKQAVAKRVKHSTMIGCQLQSGTWVYPTWQFTEQGAVDRELLEAWRILREHANAWTAALWMRSPNPDLDGHTAVECLTSGSAAHRKLAMDAARADAERWAA